MQKDSLETLLLRHYGHTAAAPVDLEERLLASVQHEVEEQRGDRVDPRPPVVGKQEDDDQQQASEEGRYREADEGECRGHMVEEGVLLDGRQNADRQGDRQADQVDTPRLRVDIGGRV